MARPRTPVGTFGTIELTKMSDDVYRARTRVRDDDGKLRRVQANGETRTAAERNLKIKLSKRASRSFGLMDLSADSSFTQLVDAWLEDLDLEDDIAINTRQLYERNMRKLVLPAFENFTLRECSVGRIERFLKTLAKNKSHSMAKQAKTVLSLAFGLAVRYEALPVNPVRETKKLKKPESRAVALSIEQVQAIRLAVREWRKGEGLNGPKPDGQLKDIIEVMLGTSARIGEVLALRKCDVDPDVTPMTVTLSGTIVSPRGRSTYRQPKLKSRGAARTIAVPSFAAAALRERLELLIDEPSEHLLFYSRNHTPLTTANVRRRLRTILAEVGITGVTPHSFRRTVATAIERAQEGNADLAAATLGHTSSAITKRYYIEKNDKVDPVTATILEGLAPTD